MLLLSQEVSTELCAFTTFIEFVMLMSRGKERCGNGKRYRGNAASLLPWSRGLPPRLLFASLIIILEGQYNGPTYHFKALL